MTHCCYMCGKLLKDKFGMFDVTVIFIYRRYTICKKCSKKIDKFINFERARNNKRRCEDE